MTSPEQYQTIKRIHDANYGEARKRVLNKFGGSFPKCEDKAGNPVCGYYDLCKQVGTYEPGKLIEPICALSDEEIKEFEIPLTIKSS